jgi:hypothetical protein
VGGHGPRDDMTLDQVTSELEERLALRVRLDTFGDDLEPEGVREVDDRREDRRVLQHL